jgi:hypothetical protein
MASHVFYTVVVDGTVIDSHESTVDDEQEARAAAIASADALATSGDQADVYRHEATGEIGEPAPKHIHTAEGRRAPA